MEHGLNERDIENIIMASEEFSEIEEVLLFGSRAKRTHKKASDVDLAIKGINISDRTIKRFSSKLNEELPLPYFIDVIHYETIKSTELTDHINRVGKKIYTRNKSSINSVFSDKNI